MTNFGKTISFIILVVLIGTFFILRFDRDNAPNNEDISVANFEECVQAGYPVAESYPRQCRTPDGKMFTEEAGGRQQGDDKSDMIRVSSPLPGASVKSPLLIEGEARGTWYFEASFPVKILDANGKELGIVPATAQGEWMTENFVPFKATLAFEKPTTPTGTLVLEKDNPSGLPEHADEIRIPVMFGEFAVGKQRAIKLYYYDSSKDKDEEGNLICSEKGLVAVDRNIPLTISPIQDTVKLLLKGELSAAEKKRGITTEFPLPGVALTGASLKQNGALVLEFSDELNKTNGGSCRVNILRAQVEATAKQFPGVKTVEFDPEYGYFQP